MSVVLSDYVVGASPMADELYPTLVPLAGGVNADAGRGYRFGIFLTVACAQGALADLVATDPTVLLDVDRVPLQALTTVEQATGALVDLRLSEALRRERVRRRAAERHGRPEEIKAAVRETLVPDGPTEPVVRLRERYDPTRPDLDPYGPIARFHLTIVTRTAQTPDPVLTAARAQQAAPDRVLVHHVLSSGRTIDELPGSIDSLTGTIDAL